MHCHQPEDSTDFCHRETTWIPVALMMAYCACVPAYDDWRISPFADFPHCTDCTSGEEIAAKSQRSCLYDDFAIVYLHTENGTKF